MTAIVTGGLAILRALPAAASGLSWTTKLILVGGLALSLVTAYGVWHHKVYRAGYEAAIAAIAREDSRAIKRALEARGKLKDCQDLQRHWNQSTGRCE